MYFHFFKNYVYDGFGSSGFGREEALSNYTRT